MIASTWPLTKPHVVLLSIVGRVAVDGVYRPGEAGAIAPNMVQAFAWTDILASGLLCLGQHIELQWHLPTA